MAPRSTNASCVPTSMRPARKMMGSMGSYRYHDRAADCTDARVERAAVLLGNLPHGGTARRRLRVVDFDRPAPSRCERGEARRSMNAEERTTSKLEETTGGHGPVHGTPLRGTAFALLALSA